jgi:hypothetical protein
VRDPDNNATLGQLLKLLTPSIKLIEDLVGREPISSTAIAIALSSHCWFDVLCQAGS